MRELRSRLDAARARALEMGVPSRRSDSQLYEMLAECLSIVDWVERDQLQEELRESVRVSVGCRGQGNAGRGRRFTQAGSDSFVVVCRWVLEGVDTRNSVYRYARALREAGARQISPEELPRWLRENGGVRALCRPAESSAASLIRELRQMAPGERAVVRMRPDGTLEIAERTPPTA